MNDKDMKTNREKRRDVLNKLYMQGWRDAEHPKCTSITMQEFAVKKAIKELERKKLLATPKQEER